MQFVLWSSQCKRNASWNYSGRIGILENCWPFWQNCMWFIEDKYKSTSEWCLESVSCQHCSQCCQICIQCASSMLSSPTPDWSIGILSWFLSVEDSSPPVTLRSMSPWSASDIEEIHCFEILASHSKSLRLAPEFCDMIRFFRRATSANSCSQRRGFPAKLSDFERQT